MDPGGLLAVRFVGSGLVVVAVGAAADPAGHGGHVRHFRCAVLPQLHGNLDYGSVLVGGVAVAAEAEVPHAVQDDTLAPPLHGLEHVGMAVVDDVGAALGGVAADLLLPGGGGVGALGAHVEGGDDDLGPLGPQVLDSLPDLRLPDMIGGVDADGQPPVRGVEEGLLVASGGDAQV